MENLTHEHHQATQGDPLVNMTERAIQKVLSFGTANQEAIEKHL